MADNPDEVLEEEINSYLEKAPKSVGPIEYYKCTRGHITIYENDGKIFDGAVCMKATCDAYISYTAKYDQTAAMHGRSRKGHILGSSMACGRAQPERELNSLSCAVLRCLTHLAMYTSSLLHKQQLPNMIPCFERTDGDPQTFLESHIKLDIENISSCCTRSKDDCILLIHDVINRMKGAKIDRFDDIAKMNSKIQMRREWEQRFDKVYIKPTFDNQVDQIQAMRRKMAPAAGSVNVKRLLSTVDHSLNNDNVLASPGLWGYRRPLTLSALRTQLHSSVQACPNLKRVVDNSEMLIATQWLPDVLSLIQVLNDRLHSKLGRRQAADESIGQFCRVHSKDIPCLQELVDNFLYAWNRMIKFYDKAANEFPELSKKDAVERFLINRKKVRSPAYILVKNLTDIHNSMLPFQPTESSSIQLSAVKQLNVVYIQSDEEILSLIAAHSEYELKETTSITYNWTAIEREVLHRYISNKRRINFTSEQLPCFVYEGDFDLHNQMQALDDTHVMESLTPELEGDLTRKLNSMSLQVQTLTNYLKELKIIINFLSVMTHIEVDNSLSEYMETTFGRVPGYLPEDVKLKHVKHVWLIVKYMQADLLMKKGQEPFDDIDGECREAITKDDQNMLRPYSTPNNPRTIVILQELFNYIILELNEEAMQQQRNLNNVDGGEQNPSEQSLWPLLTQFIKKRSNHDEDMKLKIVTELTTEANTLKVKHAAQTWSYMWKESR